MKTKKIILTFAIAGMLFNCSSSSDDTIDATPDSDPDPDPTTVTYNNTISSIMSNNCLSCHGNPTANGAPVSYTTYTQVKNDINMIINRINSSASPMPPTGLMSQNNRDLFQQWLDQGLLEN